MNSSASDDNQRDAPDAEVDVALATYLRRIDDGESIDRMEVVQRHPEIAEQLLELLDVAQQVNRMAGPTMDELESGVSGGSEVWSDAETGDADSPKVDDPSVDPFEDTVGHVAARRVGMDETVGCDPPMADDSGSELVGRTIGDYELLSVIGQGGMGVVFKARQVSMDRMVAVKMIRGGRLASREDVRRFYIEVQAAGKMGHPNIVGVHQIGEIEGHHFFSMDYVEGEDLAQRVRAEGPLEPKCAARIVRTIAEAVHAAHQKGILHRDLKPGNVLLNSNDRPFITDFGLAKHVNDDSGVTATGATMGTPSYMAPEQASGRHSAVNQRSDVYALGAILYVTLTGRPPFRSSNSVQTLLDVIHREPTAPTAINKQADHDLSTISLKCLSKEPHNRYESARQVAEELERYLAGQPIHAKPLTRLQRASHWLRDVPIFAALIGRPVAHPTRRHRQLQSALLMLLMLSPLLVWAALELRKWNAQRLPSVVEIASGKDNGMYHELADKLAAPLEARYKRTVRIKTTSGSDENLSRLKDGRSHLAVLQAEMVHGDIVVAPLYYEVVHIVARKESGIDDVNELAGRAVALGKPGSGPRLAAEKILDHYRIDEAGLAERDSDFEDLLENDALQAAVIVCGLHHRGFTELLGSGLFQLVVMPNVGDIDHPTFQTHVIHGGEYPKELGFSSASYTTLATPCFLTTQVDAPDQLVKGALEALYSLRHPGLISIDKARAWPGLALHPAAQAFFDESSE